MATLKVDTGQMTQLQPQSLNVPMSMQGVLPNSVMFANKKMSLLCCFKALATTQNSSAVSSPSGKIMSAPASMQALDRRMHSSSPYTPLASVLAQTMNYPSDILNEAYRAIFILSTICKVGISSLPLRWPQRLGNTWSQMCSPEAPEWKQSCTVLAHISPYPKPVSASAITGRLEKVLTSLMTEQNSERVLSPMSGTPEEAVRAPPETQMALKPWWAASLAMSPLKHPGTMMQSLASSCLNSLQRVIRCICLNEYYPTLQANSTACDQSRGISDLLTAAHNNTWPAQVRCRLSTLISVLRCVD